MGEVRATVEHADRDPGTVVAGRPCTTEVMGLRVEQVDVLDLVEPRSTRGRGIRIRDVVPIPVLVVAAVTVTLLLVPDVRRLARSGEVGEIDRGHSRSACDLQRFRHGGGAEQDRYIAMPRDP